MQILTDKDGYKKEYTGKVSKLIKLPDLEAFVKKFESVNAPFYRGGSIKGYVRGLCVK